MAKRTFHSVFVEVTSTGSGGRAKVLVGHPALTDSSFSDPYLTSYKFKIRKVGERLVCKVRLTGNRRVVIAVYETEIRLMSEFRDAYADILEEEDNKYNRAHGTSVTTLGPRTKKEAGVSSIPWGSTVGGISSTSPVTQEPTVSEGHTVPSKPEPKSAPEVSRDVSRWLDTIYVPKEDRELLETVRVLSETGHRAVMMIGPSGYGKTSIPQQMAKEWGMEFLRWDCATVRDPEEFFGFRGAKDGSTVDQAGETIFINTEFTSAIERGNVVVVLDELNRIDPYISNILFPLLDHAGKTSVAGHEIKVASNVIFFATINMGYQFTGTFTLDTALTNRFMAKILVSALPTTIEQDILMARGKISYDNAVNIVKLMQGLRRLNERGDLSIDASTRVSIQIAELVGAGLTIRKAVVYVIINGISEEESKLVVDQMGAVR